MKGNLRRSGAANRLSASACGLTVAVALVLAAFPAFAQRRFEGCGATKDEALSNLSEEIYLKISSDYKELFKKVGDDETLQIRSRVHVSSQLDLYGVEVSKTGDRYCAVQTEEQLRKSFLGALQEVVDSCDPDALAKMGDAQPRRISACRRSATIVDTLNPLFFDGGRQRRADMKRLRDWMPAIEELASRILHQSLTFSLDPPVAEARVVIDHEPRPLGAAIPLPAGSIKYTIQVPNSCPIEGKVSLKEGRMGAPNRKSVRHRVADFGYPKIVFETEAKRGTLMVEGKRAPLSQTIQVRRCSGSLPYALDTGPQRVTGSVSLRPGLDTTETIVVPDRAFLAKVAKQWETKSAVQVRYGGGVPLNGDIGTDWIQTVQLEYMAVFHPIRFGGGIGYGNGGGDNEHLIEAYGKVVAQLTRVGELPVHLGSRIAFVPFIGIEAGLGYQGLVPDNTGKRGDFGSVSESIIVFRTVLGTSIALNEVLSVLVEADWELATQGRRLGVNMGLGFLF